MSTKWRRLFPDAERAETEFLLDGRQAFHAIFDEIKAAKDGDFIYILGWMIDLSVRLLPADSQTSLETMLDGAARRGAAIRVLIWKNILPGYLEKAEQAVSRINKLPKAKAFFDENTFFPERSQNALEAVKLLPAIILHILLMLLFPIHLHKRVLKSISLLNKLKSLTAHHEKITIVKNKNGLTIFCGGIEYNRNRLHIDDSQNYFPKYHDNACRLRGPAAFDVLERFRQRWANHPLAREVPLVCGQETRPPAAAPPHPYAKVVGTYNSPDGSERLRTLRKAYLDIIDAAETFVYIEDQYMVSPEVASHLNAKIKEPSFEKVILVMQDSDETMDILIPNRKRAEFMSTLLQGTTEPQKRKVLRTLIDKDYWRQRSYHPGLHSKTLVVDDEIAIVGTANVNRRSFTCDSEISIVLFGADSDDDRNFARWIRLETWQEFLLQPLPSHYYLEWRPLPAALEQTPQGVAQIKAYVKDNFPDVDDRLKALIIGGGALAIPLSRKVAKGTIPAALTIEALFGLLWDYLIDPDVDSLSP
jgi:phosphatidylserine/phosphatidylglycerophosphate/cardiolipin synthase-like enzyme